MKNTITLIYSGLLTITVFAQDSLKYQNQYSYSVTPYSYSVTPYSYSVTPDRIDLPTPQNQYSVSPNQNTPSNQYSPNQNPLNQNYAPPNPPPVNIPPPVQSPPKHIRGMGCLQE